MENDKRKKVSVQVLELIYDSTHAISCRLDTLLADYYAGNISLSKIELSILLEYFSSTASLRLMLEDYIERANNLEAQAISIPSRDFVMLVALSKSADQSYRSVVGGIPLWSH